MDLRSFVTEAISRRRNTNRLSLECNSADFVRYLEGEGIEEYTKEPLFLVIGVAKDRNKPLYIRFRPFSEDTEMNFWVVLPSSKKMYEVAIYKPGGRDTSKIAEIGEYTIITSVEKEISRSNSRNVQEYLEKLIEDIDNETS